MGYYPYIYRTCNYKILPYFQQVTRLHYRYYAQLDEFVFFFFFTPPTFRRCFVIRCWCSFTRLTHMMPPLWPRPWPRPRPRPRPIPIPDQFQFQQRQQVTTTMRCVAVAAPSQSQSQLASPSTSLTVADAAEPSSSCRMLKEW